MKCPICQQDNMKECEDVFALGKALNTRQANIPALADKISLKDAMFVNVNICRNLECRHVSLIHNSTSQI
jgi:hypothetical protein